MRLITVDSCVSTCILPRATISKSEHIPANSNNTLQIGDVHITGLSDGSISFDPRVLFPEESLEIWEPYYDRFPEYFSGQFFQNNLGSFVFTSGGKRVLADSGFGPHGDMLGHPAPGELIQDFEKNGIGLDTIDTVFLTHLHDDHVGWNHFTTEEMLSDPNRGEAANRSVMPLEKQGVLDLMDGETELAHGITAFPTPGHTPGHMSLLIASNNERAMLVGDILGSPMQATETDLHYWPDWDGPMGIKTRKDILDRAEREDSVVIRSHLSYPGCGTMIRWEGRRYWKAL